MRGIPAIALAALMATIALAQDRDGDRRKSGFEYMSAATQAQQRDDSQNPAMLWLKDGQSLWSQRDGNAKSCADCHGEITRMKGVAASYPAYSPTSKRVVNLAQQINQCRADQQRLPAWPAEHSALLGLETAIAFESRGQPVAPHKSQALIDAQTRGEASYNRRIGQVDLSCKDCHDALASKRLGGNLIPEAHPTGYPIYRLEWQSVGSLQRRLRGCMTAVRAEPYAQGSPELVELEAYLAKRAAGMKLESPGVRP